MRDKLILLTIILITIITTVPILVYGQAATPGGSKPTPNPQVGISTEKTPTEHCQSIDNNYTHGFFTDINLCPDGYTRYASPNGPTGGSLCCR